MTLTHINELTLEDYYILKKKNQHNLRFIDTTSADHRIKDAAKNLENQFCFLEIFQHDRRKIMSGIPLETKQVIHARIVKLSAEKYIFTNITAIFPKTDEYESIRNFEGVLFVVDLKERQLP
jgi:hypothetical protein